MNIQSAQTVNNLENDKTLKAETFNYFYVQIGFNCLLLKAKRLKHFKKTF